MGGLSFGRFKPADYKRLSATVHPADAHGWILPYNMSFVPTNFTSDNLGFQSNIDRKLRL